MKCNLFSFFLFFAILLVTAWSDDFSLQVNAEKLSVLSPAGEKVMEIEQGTVGKLVKVGGSEFFLSFGKDVRSNLSAIISPVFDKNSPLSFTTLNKSVKSDGKAIITIRYSSGLTSAEVDGGFIGRVQIADDQGFNPILLTSDLKGPKTPAVTTSSTKAKTGTVAASLANPSQVAAVGSTGNQQKDIISLFKEEGIKGLFDAKNMTSGLERSVKSRILANMRPTSKTSTPVGNVKSITPEMLAKASQDKVGEVRLLNLSGIVLVNGKAAVEGALVPASASVTTSEKGSVVAVLGGLHLVTIHPKTSVSFSQSQADKKITTLVDLKSGTVFADVNKRSGVTQDFKVKTIKGMTSATGSKALVGWVDGKMITIVFESAWKGFDESGQEIYNISPLSTSADMGIRVVSFGSVPAMSGVDLQSMVNQIMASISDNIVQNPQGKFSFVRDPIASFVQGNATTLLDGSTNPGSTIEGRLRTLVLALTDTIVGEGDDKDASGEGGDPFQFVGNTGASGDPLLPFTGNSPSSLITGGRNGGLLQPGQTSPGGI